MKNNIAQVPLEPLPLSDAERHWLYLVLDKRRRVLRKAQRIEQEAMDALPASHPEFAQHLERCQRASYGLAMVEILTERLCLTGSPPD